MIDKLFFVEPSSNTCKSYGDLLDDVFKLRTIPNRYYSQNSYELLTMLVAAMYCSTEFALSQNPSDVCARAEPNAVNPQPVVDFAAFLESLSNSTCRIGVFTSGTTGRPKLIQHHLDTLLRLVRIAENRGNDVWALTYHPSSFAGLQVFMQALFNQNTIVSLADCASSDLPSVIEASGVTHISATPTWVRLLCSDGISIEQVRHVTTGGEITSPSLVDQVKATFPNATFRNVYASSECGSLLVSEGDCFRVPDRLANLVKVQDGQLAIHPSLVASSLKDDGDEFFLTGDCVETVGTEPLVVRFIARNSDWINVGGYKVNPMEVEQTLGRIPGVVDARVFGRKNSVTGSIVCCELVLAKDCSMTQTDIRREFAKRLEPYKVPRLVEFVDVLDRTLTGKKRRTD